MVTVIIAMPGAYAIARKNLFLSESSIYPVYGRCYGSGTLYTGFCNKNLQCTGNKKQLYIPVLIYTAFNLSQAVFLFTGYISSLDKGLDEAARLMAA